MAAMVLLTIGCSREPESAPTGEKIYNRYCFSCHAAGVAGAPRVGDAEAWAPRVAKGREALLESVRNGVPPGMPPMGLCSDCSDQDLAAAVDHMIRNSVP